MKKTLAIKILIDNNPNLTNLKLVTEHGFALTFSYEGKNWLYDTGLSGDFADNAALLKVDLKTIDYLVLSHGHIDHTGGLKRFLEYNNKASIIASPLIIRQQYYSFRHENPKEISTDQSLLKHNAHFISVSSSQWLTPTIAIVQNTCDVYPKPIANKTLMIKKEDGLYNDSFKHEYSLCIVKDNALVVLSSCSHNGVLNILQSCRTFCNIDKVSTFIGGMHLLDDYETKKEIQIISKEIQNEYPQLKLYSGHCTGKKQLKLLKKYLGDSFDSFYSGWSLDIE
ncbi:MAG: MBL fold metallo-hydrolase [Massilibacteroides sp.]|nr:MBL fold metallo-hydrolase [Massilibacteroides sp.]